MLEQFRNLIKEKRLIRKSARILLTVSGGIDSVVMLDLFIRSGYTCGIAHCNFGLRGDESDGDEDFVRQLAYQHGIKFHCKRFSTEEYAEEAKISIQMAARKLRYDWFEKIRLSHSYHLIATAHNQDDVIETFFINLIRGSGIRGLTGIKYKTGNIIRPLLFASRSQIEEYANVQELSFREDSSNASEKYTRNKIRHKILPLLESINPSFRSSIIETINKLGDTEDIYNFEVNRRKEEMVEENGDTVTINIEHLKDIPHRRTYLYEFLSEFQFTPRQIKDIDDALEAGSGKQFFSLTSRLVKDRSRLLITPIEHEEHRKFYVEEGTDYIFEPVHLEFEVVKQQSTFQIPHDRYMACLDFDLLTFPLLIRKWQSGDYFHPLGMKHRKKLSDFLVDQKLSIVDKENLWLIINNEDIIWVINQRIDDRYKISEKTRKILKIKSVR
jgi:tRNA(Ile)-lysidine synthase